MTRGTLALALAALATTATAPPAVADPSSGVDGALFRSSYDANGGFAVEGARLLPRHDVSLKLLVGHGRAPLAVAVPGIGDAAADRILADLTTIDLAVGLAITSRLALGLDVAAYRTRTAAGYGVRGRYLGAGQATPSTGLIALRPLSNLDPSASPDDGASYLGDGLAGPLDARFGLKLGVVQRPHLAIAALASIYLPFGEDEMLLGDRGVVLVPGVAAEWRPDPARATRVLASAELRLRRRAVLESFDALDPAATDADAQVFLDVGSELVGGVAGVLAIAPRAQLALEAQLFVPAPAALDLGRCRRHDGAPCGSLTAGDYFAGAGDGDLAALVTAGGQLQVSADLAATLMLGASPIGARGDDVRLTVGLTWAPQPAGAAAPGSRDRDGDAIRDGVDGCPDEAEDPDGFQDEDGCPDPDNDHDGIADLDDRCADDPEDVDRFEDDDGCPERDNDADAVLDAVDRCPAETEDRDGFEDEDGCPDPDNDRDGIPDATDRCPGEPETANGFEDDDGCPDVRGAGGPVLRDGRIELGAATLAFTAADALTPGSRQLLDQVAALIKDRPVVLRVEVHVAASAAARRDLARSRRRARAIVDYLIARGVARRQVQAIGRGAAPAEQVELIEVPR